MTFLVLVVEDTQDSAKLLLDVLPCFGFRVRHARDGEAAIGAAAEALPDVVLMDLHLPGIDGIETMRRIRAACGARQPRFIAVTASVTAQDQAAVRDAGFDGFHAKPVEMARLVEHIRTLLGASPTNTSAPP